MRVRVSVSHSGARLRETRLGNGDPHSFHRLSSVRSPQLHACVDIRRGAGGGACVLSLPLFLPRRPLLLSSSVLRSSLQRAYMRSTITHEESNTKGD